MGFFSKTDFLILKTMIMKVFPEMTNFLLSVFHSGTPIESYQSLHFFTIAFRRIIIHLLLLLLLLSIYIYIYI